MAKNIIIPKIIVKKISSLMGNIEILETKEFSQCVIQSFSIRGEIVSFSFRYLSYSDSYVDFGEDGAKQGNVATEADSNAQND
jgi:hypothetical protein